MRRRTLSALLAALAAALAAAFGLAARAAELPVANAALLRSARVFELHGRNDLARLALEKLAAARPDAPEYLAELGELDLRAGDFAAARAILARLRANPAASRRADDLAVGYRLATVDRPELQAVRRLLDTGRGAAALTALERLYPAGAPGGAAGLEYYTLLAGTPQGWDAARRGFEALARARPEDPRPRLALARHLAARPATAGAALALLGPLSRRDDLDAREIEAVRTAAIRAGARAVALHVAPRADAEPPPPSGAPAAARARAAELDQRAQLELASGDAGAARRDFAAALELAPDAAWIRYRLARRHADEGDPERGRALLAAGRSLHPDDVDLRYAEALYLSAIEAPAAALAAAEAIAPAERTPGIEALISRLSERLASAAQAPPPPAPPTPGAAVAAAAGTESSGWIAAGLGLTDKPGDPGVSALRSLQLPFEWHVARAGLEGLSLRADAVRLDAGRLPRSFEAAALVGTVAAAGPAVVPRLDPGRATSGVALGVAFRGALVRADLGTTPLGFPVVNAVGGVRLTPSLGPVDVSVGLARRPVTGSALSYAGREDPASGRVWGGVTETGPSLQVGRYADLYSLAVAVRVSRLDGRHVLANQFTGARFAADRRLFERAGVDFDAGVAVSYWSYAHSLLGYTYGSGGYYSPQSYLSVAVPLEASGTGAGWNFRARTALAVTTSRTASAAYFPLDPSLGSAAAAMLGGPASAGAGRSTGASLSLYFAAERAVGQHLVVGAALDLDRSDYYHPTTLLLYLRHALGQAPTRANAPPRPLRPYADY